MVKLVNNSERAITIVDVLLSPGQPKEVSQDLYNHPSVQSMLKERMPGKEEFVLSHADEGEANEPEPQGEDET